MKKLMGFMLLVAGLLWWVPAHPGLNPAQALLDQLNGVTQAQVTTTCRATEISTGEANCGVVLMTPTELARLAATG